MKKIALTSLIAMFAFAGAHAANVIDGNPLYMPKKGHFYSVTDVNSHTDKFANGDKQINTWALGEEFGYGVTDKLMVTVNTDFVENEDFNDFTWGNLGLNVTFRAFDMKGWKADAVVAYEAGTNPRGIGGLYVHHKTPKTNDWFEKDLTGYTWTAGVRGGYVASNWTVAGHAMFDYMNSESFNLGDKGLHEWRLGMDAQYVLSPKVSLLAGVEYTGITNDKWAYDDIEFGDVKNAGKWAGEFGVNYNIDATKFVGVYVNGSLNHNGGTSADEWEWDKGFGFGAKFGIDF